MMTTISDVHAAVVDLRPDADAVGVEIAEDHVRLALGAVRYEDVDHEMLLALADRAVEIALGAVDPIEEEVLVEPDYDDC